MKTLFHILFSGLAVIVASYVLPGVHVDGYLTAVIVAVVLGVVNFFVKPLVLLLTLPITIMTLGLFYFIINALMVLLVARLVPGFMVDGFWTALLFSLIVSVVSWFLNRLNRPAYNGN